MISVLIFLNTDLKNIEKFDQIQTDYTDAHPYHKPIGGSCVYSCIHYQPTTFEGHGV